MKFKMTLYKDTFVYNSYKQCWNAISIKFSSNIYTITSVRLSIQLKICTYFGKSKNHSFRDIVIMLKCHKYKICIEITSLGNIIMSVCPSGLRLHTNFFQKLNFKSKITIIIKQYLLSIFLINFITKF